jgi:ABC-type transporter Mla subunit MlaD
MQIKFNKEILVKGFIAIIFLFSLGYLISYYAHSINSPRPKMRIMIKYRQVPPIIQDFPRTKIKAYYRGLYVGEVSKINLSDDQKYIVFYMNIYYDKLKLPKNTFVELNTEDLYGARHFLLSYPDNPSSQMLKDGDVIYGDVAYERIDKVLSKEFANGNTARLLSNLVFMTDSLKSFAGLSAEDSQALAQGLKKSSGEVQLILQDLRQIIDDPEVEKDIKSIIKSSSGSMKNVEGILSSKEIKQTISDAPTMITKTVNNIDGINKNLDKTNHELPKVNSSLSATNCLLSGTNCNLDALNKKLPVIPEIPPELLPNADKALKKTICLLDELPEILSKRFLGLRLVFGKPAASLKRCGKSNCRKTR